MTDDNMLTPSDYPQLIADLRAENADLRAALARVAALGTGSGYIMGDDTLVRLGAVRAALRGKP